MKVWKDFFPVIVNRFVCHVYVCVLQHTAVTGSLVTFYANLHRPQAPFPLVSGCLPSRASCRGINIPISNFSMWRIVTGAPGACCASSSSSIKWPQLTSSLKNTVDYTATLRVLMQEENKKLQKSEDVSLGKVCTLYLLTSQVRSTVGGSGFCCCACVTSFKSWLTPLWVYSPNKGVHSAIWKIPAGVFKSLTCVCLHARSETNCDTLKQCIMSW